MRDLGYCYHEGLGVKTNHAKAAMLYRLAAKAGDSKAQWNLALSYRDAHGVSRSRRWSAYWMEKSANNGNAGAQEYVAREAHTVTTAWIPTNITENMELFEVPRCHLAG